MARPGSIIKTSEESSGLLGLLKSRKARLAEAQEEAARQITNDAAKNQALIVDKLRSIDFLHSKLPKHILETKSREGQRCCDLESAAKALATKLEKNVDVITMDIRPFDEKLLVLVDLWRQAVEIGQPEAAYAAKAAVASAITKIRLRLPQDQPELAKQFVATNTKYLEDWITLIQLSQNVDALTAKAEHLQRDYAAKEAKDSEKTENLRKWVLSSMANENAFNKLMDGGLPADSSTWSAEERDVYSRMIERRVEQLVFRANGVFLQRALTELSAKTGNMDMLFIKLAEPPIVTDPDLINKYNAAIDDMFKELAESDTAVEEALKAMDDIAGRLAQLDSMPGNIRARNVAQEQAQKSLEDMKNWENRQIQERAANGQVMSNLGLRSDEELEAEKRRVEEELQARLDEIYEEQQEEVELQEEKAELLL